MRMSPINSIARYCIEFSSLILLVVVLLLMHGIGEATYTKQLKITNNPSKANTLSDKNIDFGFNPEVEDDILRFTPESIDFGKGEIGRPLLETVQVWNSHPSRTIEMVSVSGSSPFYCSDMSSTILSPRSNATLTVAFLARAEGLVNNTLTVHSTVGLSRIRLYGYGEPSQFRLRPLVGRKILLNSTYSSVVYLYNPFPTPIQLTEVYSSGADLQLELLDNSDIGGRKIDATTRSHKDRDTSLAHWNIPPYEYRPIMKMNFAGKVVSNHTAFIRIHLNSTERTQLVLPVEIEVCSKPGLYSSTNFLDFGTVVPQHLNQFSFPSLPIELINTISRSVTIDSIEFDGPSYGARIDFKSPAVVGTKQKAVSVGRLVLDSQNISCIGHCASRVIINFRDKAYQPLTIDFVMNVVDGRLSVLEHDTNHLLDSLRFSGFEGKGLTSGKEIWLANRFAFPIVLNRITSDTDSLIFPDVPSPSESSQKHVLLQPGEDYKVMSYLKIHDLDNKSPDCIQRLFDMNVKTNLSNIHIPIRFLFNCVKIYFPGSSERLTDRWNLGVVSPGESISTFFILLNDGIDSLQIRSAKSMSYDFKQSSVFFQLVGQSDSQALSISDALSIGLPDLEGYLSSANLAEEETLYSLQVGHFAVFRLIFHPSSDGEHRESFPIYTNFGSVDIPVKFAVSDIKIVAEKAWLSKTFPGRVVSTQVNIKSYNSVPVRVKRISLETNDKRFRVDVPPGYVLQPGDNNEVKVTFDPSAICPPLVCYASLDIEKEVGHFWLLGHGVYSDTAYIDKELYKLVRNQWMTHSELDLAPSANFRFHTDGFGSFNSEVQAQLHWPRLSNKFALKFPALRVGRKLVKDIVIENPADKPIIVQAVHVANYPNADVLLQMMQSIVFHKQWASSDIEAIEKTILDSNNLSAFGFATSSAQGLKLTDANRVYDWLGVKPSPESFTMLLPPGARQRLGVTFRPLVERNFTSLLILRNNLTVIEVVVLRGEGGIGMLKIDSHHKSSNSVETSSSLSSSSSSSLSPYYLSSTTNSDSLQAESSKIIFEFPKTTLDRLCLYSPYSTDDDEDERIGDDDEDGEYSSFSLKTSGKNKFVIRHRFKATNIGRMGLQIRHFFIDSLPCEGFGFQVKNCEPIQLQPNQSFDLEMTYSPDFTQTTVKHNLILLLDDEFTQWQKFELIVSIPGDYLHSCLSALPRPAWEAYVGRCLFMITTFLIVLTVFVAYTDATKLVSGYGFSLSDTESNTDDDSQSVFDDDDSKPIVNSNGHSNGNGNLLNHNGNKSQNGKLKQRKNAKVVTQQNQQMKQKNKTQELNNGNDLKEDKPEVKQFCDQDTKHRLSHQNSSSSENESFSETSSSNRQSTESLCDIPIGSRKNSIETEQQPSRGKENKEHNKENGQKKRKNKVEWKKLDVGKQSLKNESMQSLYFPPIEEFESMIKTRSQTHPGQKTKADEKKLEKNRKLEGKSLTDSSKQAPKKTNSKPLGRELKEPTKNAWNCDDSITDIWRQPSHLSNDIFNFNQPPKRPDVSSLPKPNDKWIVGEWSNEIVKKPQPSQCQPQPRQSSGLFQDSPNLPGYFGLRFDSGRNSPSFMKAESSAFERKIPETEASYFVPKKSFGWLKNPTQQPTMSVWDNQRNTQSPLSSTSSTSQTFSPIIAPPKSTSPSSSNTVQQIAQQDQYFHQRSRASQPTTSNFPATFDSSRMNFNDFQRDFHREPLFNMDSASTQRISRIAPPPGFGSQPSSKQIDNNLSWLSDPFPAPARAGSLSRRDGFESNSIWDSTDSNLDQWPSRTTTTPELGSDSLWRHEPEPLFADSKMSTMDGWLSNDRRSSDFINSTWGSGLLSGLPSNSQSQIPQQIGDSLRKSTPSPSSSSSSNGRNQ